MKIIEKEDEIILRDTPLLKCFFGAMLTVLFAGMGIFLVYDVTRSATSIFSLQNGWLSISFEILWFLFILVVIGGVIHLFLSQTLTPMFSVRIKPAARTIDIIRRRLFFIASHQRFYFSQVKSFALLPRSEGDKILYFTTLRLVNDDEIELESSGSSTNYNSSKINMLNGILKKHHPKNKGKTARVKRRKADRKVKEPEK